MQALVWLTVLAVLASVGLSDKMAAGSGRAHTLSIQEQIAHHHVRTLVSALLNGTGVSNDPNQLIRLGTFSFTNCAKPSKELLVLSGLNVKPDPIKLPGTVIVSGNATSSMKFGDPLKASLSIYKKVFGVFIEVPCIGNIGSCTYDDVCTMLKQIKTCPPLLVKQGINCRCPIPALKTSLKGESIKIDYQIPAIAAGEVKVRAELTSGKTYITCAEFIVNLA